MRIIPLAEWKANAELRIKLGEFLQADELVLAACSRPHVQRDPQLMMGDASHHDALALFHFLDMRSARTRALLADAHAFLLLRRAICRRYRDGTMHGDEGLQELTGRRRKRPRQTVDVLIFVCLAIVIGRARPLARQALQKVHSLLSLCARPWAACHCAFRANGCSRRSMRQRQCE